MTVHAHEEMAADALTWGDAEQVLLTGEIVERQKDKQTNEAKYVLEGGASNATRVVTKISPSGRLVIITLYRTAAVDGR